MPENSNLSNEDLDLIFQLWRTTARQVSMMYGVFVSVRWERALWDGPVARIYFVADGHEFDSLSSLKRTLRMKAFL